MSEDDSNSISLPIVGDEETGDQQQEEQERTEGDEAGDVLEAIDREVTGNGVVLYMKGTPEQPMCGFSARAAQILQAYGVDFHAVNVLDEEDKRDGIKEYGDWKTIPQLYVGGELVGGSDIMMKMHESGQLEDVFADAGIDYAAG
jgi:monothiol glutaredoxin